MALFDRTPFLRPIAHRGLHDAKAGRTENSRPAFEAAIAHGFGIECDLRPGRGGLPVVFHDKTLERVTNSKGLIAQLTAESLRDVLYPDGSSVMTFEDLLRLVSGRVPLLVEIKSEWDPPDAAFLSEIARLSQAYTGPIALMSFDPAVLTAMRALAPAIPRGIVSGLYESEDGDAWWSDKIDKDRAYRLAHLLESSPVDPAFIAYHIKALPTPVMRFVREVLGLPVFTWTVRDAGDLARARQWADAPIFEGIDPA
ncbi:MAG: glycerophosphodiester phosphodiesterase family protein [Hyphomicrobium sp.]